MMANEATVRTALQIRKTSGDVTLLEYNSQPSGFNATVTGTKGPVPGAVTVTTSGTNIDLTQLTTPGLCRIMNQDATNYVEVGVKDASTGYFYPLMELLPGESYVFRFSRNVGEEYYSTTGTDSGNSIHCKANTASVVVLIEAFES
jgi:hypothetical protein